MKNILKQFTNYVHQIGYSKNSQYQIPHCIAEFIEVVNKKEREITQIDILKFYEYLQTRPLKNRVGVLSEAMINHYVFALKTFFNWLETTEQINDNPISNLKFKRQKNNSREPLSQEQIQSLFSATKTAKEKALLHLFYSVGLRRTEAENLNTIDIHFSKNILYVREGKGAKRRAIPINEKVKNELLNYQNTKVNNPSNEAFMFNERGNRMSGNSYNNLLKAILTRADLNPEFTLHHLRHSIATHLLENGMSIEFVRDFLGHTHLEATQIYTKVNLQKSNL